MSYILDLFEAHCTALEYPLLQYLNYYLSWVFSKYTHYFGQMSLRIDKSAAQKHVTI